jgi:hypothetical protein
MKKLLFVFALLCLLAACTQPMQAPATPNESERQIPLLTDADFDKAVKQPAPNVTELFGSQESAATLQELPPLADMPFTNGQGELSAQVHRFFSGELTYAAHNSLLNFDGSPAFPPYSISYQKTDDSGTTTTKIYEGYREIQSVDHSYDRYVISMRETTDGASDFEIFVINLDSGGNTTTIEQITSDDVDNINVCDCSSIYYEEPISGKSTVVIRDYSYNNKLYNKIILSHPDPQHYPRNGNEFITVVRDPINGNDSIQMYNPSTNSYLTVAESPSPTVRMDSPSSDRHGTRVLWLETDSNGFQEIKYVWVNGGTVRTVASGTALARPYLNSFSYFPVMTYQVGRSIVVKNIDTGEAETVLAPNPLMRFIRFYSPTGVFYPQSWLQVNISGLPSGQNRVRVTGYQFDSGHFGTSQAVGPLRSGTYTVSASGFKVGKFGTPTCRIYSPSPATQTAVVADGQTKTVSVSYSVEPCDSGEF